MSLLMQSWPGHPVALVLSLVVAAVLALFVLRRQARRLILFVAHALAAPLRRAEQSLATLAREVAERNRVVLLAQARAETGGFLEQELRSVDETLRRDLEPFPVVSQRLLEQIAAIEDDHRQSREQPPPAPEWTRAVAMLARIKPSGDRSIEPLLRGLRKEVTQAQRQALSDYRKSCESRHRSLQAALPALERVRRTLERVDQDLVRLRERATSIDDYMRRYDSIRRQEDWIERTLRSSAVIQFLTAALLAGLAAGALVIEHTLLSGVLAGPPGLARGVAAALLVLEAALGVVLTDSLGLTTLVPVLARAGAPLRRRLRHAAGGLTALAAGAQAALPFLGGQGGRFAGLLAPVELATVLAALPLALAFAAIPLERLMHGLRTVSGLILVHLLQLAAWALRQAARLIRHAGLAVLILYDALVFLPLAVHYWRQGPARRARAGSPR